MCVGFGSSKGRLGGNGRLALLDPNAARLMLPSWAQGQDTATVHHSRSAALGRSCIARLILDGFLRFPAEHTTITCSREHEPSSWQTLELARLELGRAAGGRHAARHANGEFQTLEPLLVLATQRAGLEQESAAAVAQDSYAPIIGTGSARAHKHSDLEITHTRTATWHSRNVPSR